MTTRNITKALAFLTLALPLMLMGCEGDQGPAGPEGPPGPPGEGATASDFTFVGDNGTACTHCHGSTVNGVMLTHHTMAFDDLSAESQDNPYCLQCHTVGWDRPVEFGDDGWMSADNPDTNGYDDYYGVEGEEAAARRAALEGVQCENCHGAMGPDFNSHTPNLSFATIGSHDPANVSADDITSVCYPCHSTQFEGPAGDFDGGYATSGHASAAGGDLDAFNEEHYASDSCGMCHTSEGFIMSQDASYSDYDFGSERNFIGCVTCHDPHANAEEGQHQLRSVADQALLYVDPIFDTDFPPTMTGKGNGQLCAQCHHARRDNANVEGQIANGSGHMGPHHSAQADMYVGAGSYEIPGYDYGEIDPETVRGMAHYTSSVLSDGCVNCHMIRETELHGEVSEFAFHNFRVEVSEQCQMCHPGADETLVTDYQAGIVDLLNQLAGRFGAYADWADFEENWDSRDPSVETWQREAAYAIYFVTNDGSFGVHNPDYAEALLNNAIDYYDSNTP